MAHREGRERREVETAGKRAAHAKCGRNGPGLRQGLPVSRRRARWPSGAPPNMALQRTRRLRFRSGRSPYRLAAHKSVMQKRGSRW
jgi:hypothetical protein